MWASAWIKTVKEMHVCPRVCVCLFLSPSQDIWVQKGLTYDPFLCGIFNWGWYVCQKFYRLPCRFRYIFEYIPTTERVFPATTSVVKATPWRTSLNAADVFSLSSFYITVVVVVVAAAAATAFVIWEQRTTQNLCKVIKGWTKDSAFAYCCGSSVSIIFSINCNHTNIFSSVKQQQQERTSNTNTQTHSYTVACKPFKRKQEMTIKYQFCK